jgi:hypothetical protein
MSDRKVSEKRFSVELMKQETRVRVRHTLDVKYNPEVHFMFFEDSDYLDRKLNGVPYSTFRTDDQNIMEDFLQNGYRDGSGMVWRSFFAFWKDQEGRAYMCPEFAKINELADVGIFTHMKSPADFMKVGKYVNRLFSSLPKRLYGGTDPAWGIEVDWNEDEQYALIQIEPHDDLTQEDCLINVKYVDLNTLSPHEKALVDGCMPINEKAARALGLTNNPRKGQVWRGTFGTQRGLGKGHMPLVPHSTQDVIIYGPKTILKTDEFFFGNMGELHVGSPHTDRQSFVNFGYHRKGLAVDLAKTYMKEVIAKSKDEAGMRQLILSHTKDTPNSELGVDGWILRRALAYGVSYLRFPGLFRRGVRYLAGPDSPVFQCDTRARIPMEGDTYSIAKYGYVVPDLNTIDSEGVIHPELGIGPKEIIFPDLEPGTKVVCYRQPSENSNAWVELTVADKPEFKSFKGRGICMLGQGALEVLQRLGGGDMDDQFVIVHDPKWVDAFRTLRKYPETGKLSDVLTEDEQQEVDETQSMLSEFTDELLYDIRERGLTRYTNKHVHWQIDMARNARAGIGPVVNYGIMDMLMSDPEHKASMLEDLSIVSEERQWLEEREDYQAAVYMTNLELIIDGNVKDNTLLAKLGDVAGTIRQFHKTCKVYPESQAMRIPQKRREKGDYVLAKSLTCKALDEIKALRERLLEIFAEREWAIVTPADRELRDAYYPYERELAIRIAGEWEWDSEDKKWSRINEDELSLKDVWGQAWREEFSHDRDHSTAYQRIVKEMKELLVDEDDDMMERLAVHLYYDTYKTYQSGPQMDDRGNIRGYHDGLLWSPVFANHFINALRKARLTGFYKVCKFAPDYINALRNASVGVQVRSNSVYVQDEADQYTKFVGLVDGMCPNGIFRMDAGIIEVRAPKPICLPEDYVVSMPPLKRLFPSVQEQSVLKPQEDIREPKGVVGKLLKKALDMLK